MQDFPVLFSNVQNFCKFHSLAFVIFFVILCVNTGNNDAIMYVKSLRFSNVIIFVLKHMYKTLLELRKRLSVVNIAMSQWSTQYDSSQ